jgi:DNA-binding CsgD family transcriptional regulator
MAQQPNQSTQSKASTVLTVAICEHGRGLGALKSGRACCSKPFSCADEASLKSIAPYIAHTVRAQHPTIKSTASSGESGVIVVDHRNRVVQFSNEGMRLLRLSINPHIASSQKNIIELPDPLKAICENLRAVLRGKPSPPPVMFHASPWGGFTFRAFWLNNIDGQEAAFISLVIERHIPKPLKLIQSMQMYELTFKEREVCLLLSQGFSHAEIALQMQIKPNTVIDYVRNIYSKLDVHNHNELFKMLEVSDISI